MKTVRSICLLLSLLASATCAQLLAQFNVYHPFPDSNAVWGMGTGCMDGQCGDAAYIQYYYEGDTMMDGYLYHRVLKSYAPSSNNGCCTPPNNWDAGYMREDTETKRIYWRMQGLDMDTMLYDFSVNIGDTLPGYMGSCDLPWIVGSIDSILIGSNYRKRINYEVSFDPGVQFSIIEGIGSTYGLTTCPFIPFEMGIYLYCFTVDGNVLYPSASPDMTACGDLTNSVHVVSPRLNASIQLSPNPSTELLNVQCSVSQLPLEIYVIDMSGRLLEQKLLAEVRSSIDISRFAKGFYFLYMRHNGALISTEKFIKQ